MYRYQDEQGRDVQKDSQFTISTKFADPELLKRVPPPVGGTPVAPPVLPPAPPVENPALPAQP